MDAALDIALPPDSIETAFPTDDEGFFDFIYLPEHVTGVEGRLFLSTKVAQHGPRVKWLPGSPGPGRPSCSFTLDEPPRLVASSLPTRVTNAMISPISAWINLNREALIAFWNEGAFWEEDRRDVFKTALKPLPR